MTMPAAEAGPRAAGGSMSRRTWLGGASAIAAGGLLGSGIVACSTPRMASARAPRAPDAEVPPEALDHAAFPSTRAWLEAIEREGRPGAIGSGRYDVSGLGGMRLSRPIFGYDSGSGLPVFEGHGALNFLYLCADDITLQRLAFRDIKMPVISVDRSSADKRFNTSTHWQPELWDASTLPPDLVHDAPLAGLHVLDCDFEACGIAVYLLRLGQMHKDIQVSRNTSRGGMGFFSMLGRRFERIHLLDNQILEHDSGEVRAGDPVNTLFLVSRDNELAERGLNHTVRINGNRIQGFRSAHAGKKVNGSVFADVRNCHDVEIAGNLVEDCFNSVGNSDANAVYTKADQVRIVGNSFKNCGASPGRADSGSEGGCITMKGGTSDVTIRENVFAAGNIEQIPFISAGTANRVTIEDCEFQGWFASRDGWPEKRHGPPGAVVNWRGGPVDVINPVFKDCHPTYGYAMVYWWKAESGGLLRDWHVDFAGNRQDIVFTDKNIDVRVENAFTSSGAPIEVVG